MKLISILFSASVLSADQCHGESQSGCLAQQGCVWCDARAVPSACYTEDEAQRLPAVVFECQTPGFNKQEQYMHIPFSIPNNACSFPIRPG